MLSTCDHIQINYNMYNNCKYMYKFPKNSYGKPQLFLVFTSHFWFLNPSQRSSFTTSLSKPIDQPPRLRRDHDHLFLLGFKLTLDYVDRLSPRFLSLKIVFSLISMGLRRLNWVILMLTCMSCEYSVSLLTANQLKY